ncbi:MAB_1171c family putative transporter [Symbioplanes lichenis]|uniref:MAB_1171c family putative transporter n=1 Tax=Symbioplanes lichenis TaxID=1629072 RepID=UPI0027399E5F|nr:MAB_1171c family putative transporter [Actinoplanes lichenis]
MSHAAAVNGAFATMGVLLVSTAVTAHRRGAPASPARGAFTGALGILGVSFLVQSPAARELQNALISNLGQLTGNGTTLIAAYLMQVGMVHILHDRPRAGTLSRRWLIPLVAALAGLTAFFLATPTAAGRFTSPDAPAGVVAYYLVYTGYLAVTLSAMVLLLRRYAARVDDRHLRLSLRLYAWSCAVGMLYLAGRIGALVVGRIDPDLMITGDRYGLLELIVATVVPATALALVVLAVLIRVVGRAVDHRRAIRRLQPLWEAIREVRPHAVLPVSAPGARLRLYRRVVEIQDGRLAAAAHVRPETLAAIDQASTSRATRDAAILAAGLAALRAGLPAHDAAPPDEDEPDLAAVVRHLEQVSAAYNRLVVEGPA